MQLFLLLFLGCSAALFGGRPQNWLELEIPLAEAGGFEFSCGSEGRFELSGYRLLDGRLILNCEKALSGRLTGGAHYTLIHSRSREESVFKRSHRLEADLSSRLFSSDRFELETRTRLEWNRREEEAFWSKRLRQRGRLFLKCEKGVLKGISTELEAFYHLERGHLDEWRYIPLEARFSKCSFYGMSRWRRSSAENWKVQFVAGANLSL